MSLDDDVLFYRLSGEDRKLKTRIEELEKRNKELEVMINKIIDFLYNTKEHTVYDSQRSEYDETYLFYKGNRMPWEEDEKK